MAERSIVEIPASEGNSQDTALFSAVEHVVFASLQASARRMYALAGGHETEPLPPLPIVVVKGADWRFRFDVFDNFTREEREEIANMIAAAIASAAVELPWFSMGCCTNVDHARGFMGRNSPVGAITEYTARMQAEVLEYLEAAGGCGADAVGLLVTHLKRLGDHGASLASMDEGEVVNPLDLWFAPAAPGLCYYPALITEAVWVDVIAPKVEREAKNARNPAAVTLSTFGTLEALMFTKNVRVVANDRQPELFADDRLIATAHLRDVALVDVLTKATPALKSYAAVRLLVWAVDTVKTRHFLGEQYPNILTVDGGLSALAELAGLGGSNGNITALRQILTAGQAWNVAWPNGREVHGLWNYDVSRAGRGSAAVVTMTIASALTPHGAGRGILTPIVSINDLDGITSRNHLGALAAFKQGIVKAIVEQRLDLSKHGGALITDRDFATIAARCGVPSKVTPKAVQAWLSDRDEGPAFLEVNRGRFHIADNEEYGAVRAFIDDTANIAKTKSARGKKGAQKRAAGDGEKR